jgi:hypothetical protein
VTNIESDPIGNVVTQYFGFDGGYSAEDTLEPGKGYWVKVNFPGTLSINGLTGQAAPIASKNQMVQAQFNSLSLTDNNGKNQRLYFGEEQNNNVQLEQYEMPPVPPAGIFDVRFTTQRYLETYSSELHGTSSYEISLQNISYPLHIKADLKQTRHQTVMLEEIQNGKTTASHNLTKTNTVTILSAKSTHLLLKVNGNPSMPKEFALGQNYPNPFNPVTRFTVEVPRNAVVEVAVYDILGRKVTTLMNGEQEAGYHTIEWNSTNSNGQAVASGMYFIRMASDDFNAVRKVLLMK